MQDFFLMFLSMFICFVIAYIQRKAHLRSWYKRKCIVIILCEWRLNNQHRDTTGFKESTAIKSKAENTKYQSNRLPILKHGSVASSPISKPKRNIKLLNDILQHTGSKIDIHYSEERPHVNIPNQSRCLRTFITCF